MHDYLEKLRAMPKQARERVAFGAAAAATAIVFVAWAAVVATNGTFALAPSTFDVANTDASRITDTFAQTGSGFSDLLGAAAAFQSGSPPAGIIVETKASTTADKGTPAVIPF